MALRPVRDLVMLHVRLRVEERMRIIAMPFSTPEKVDKAGIGSRNKLGMLLQVMSSVEQRMRARQPGNVAEHVIAQRIQIKLGRPFAICSEVHRIEQRVRTEPHLSPFGEVVSHGFPSRSSGANWDW